MRNFHIVDFPTFDFTIMDRFCLLSLSYTFIGWSLSCNFYAFIYAIKHWKQIYRSL